MGMRSLAFVFLACCWHLVARSSPIENGEVIYMKGVDREGITIASVLNDLNSDVPLGCVNCHRESGFGSSESGQTFPPVSWRFLGKNQPENDLSPFYHIQNKRKAYTADSFYRLMTTGVNSNGEFVNELMPKYALTREQSDDLIAYLKTISPANDPGVDGDEIRIATIVDKRLPASERAQHIAFLKGLFEMKNGLTRGEIKRKNNSPIQKVPQYESFRFWKLVVWELPEDPVQWAKQLENNYQNTPVFTIMRPIVSGDYSKISDFCSEKNIPCLFPSGKNLPKGDFYNFVFRNVDKQYADYLNSKRREYNDRLLYVDRNGQIQPVRNEMMKIPFISNINLEQLTEQYNEYCSGDYRLLINGNIKELSSLENLKCLGSGDLQIVAMNNETTDYQAIAQYIKVHESSQLCWATDYDKVLKRNLRAIRVNALVRRFKIDNPDYEELAKSLLSYGLLTDSLHKMAGNFTRLYMMEIIEHMLNSFPNYTFFTSITGAPYQRYIVGPLNDFCRQGQQS